MRPILTCTYFFRVVCVVWSVITSMAENTKNEAEWERQAEDSDNKNDQN